MDAASRAQAIIAELEKFKDHLKDITRTTGRIQKTVIVDAVILCLKEGIAPPTAKIIARAATTLSGQPRGAIKKAVWDTRELYQRWSTAQERHFPLQPSGPWFDLMAPADTRKTAIVVHCEESVITAVLDLSMCRRQDASVTVNVGGVTVVINTTRQKRK